jgi:hypothetical protein
MLWRTTRDGGPAPADQREQTGVVQSMILRTLRVPGSTMTVFPLMIV